MTKTNLVPGLVGVVTVTYNSGTVLPDFIRSIDAQTYASLMIVAVDNASKDDSVAQLRAWTHPALTVVANQANLGVAQGNNQGIEAALAAGCEYVLLLNNDVVFGPQLISQLVLGIAEHACGMTTPLIYYADRPTVIWAAGGLFKPQVAYLSRHIGDNEEDRGQYAEPRVIDDAPTCWLLVKRQVFDTIGLMDARYFVYFDDTDFMLRALRAGVVTYYRPEPKLWHKVSSLTGFESPFAQRYMARNRAFFIRKHLGFWAISAYTVIYRTYYLVRYLIRRDDRQTLRRKQQAWSEGLKIS